MITTVLYEIIETEYPIEELKNIIIEISELEKNPILIEDEYTSLYEKYKKKLLYLP